MPPMIYDPAGTDKFRMPGLRQGVAGTVVPANALTFNGEALTFAGEYLTFGAA